MPKLTLISGFAGLLACAALFAQAPKPAGQPAPKPQAPTDKPAQGAAETVAVLQTKLGNIVVKFFPDKAPNHVKNFENLCRSGFYNGTKFHRIIPGFMIQGGDPNTRGGDPSTWGTGGNTDKSGQEIHVKAEFNNIHHVRGILSMARSQHPDSASSQFFICVADAGYLDGQYTAFGQVIAGMDVADAIVNAPRKPGDRPVTPVAIDRAYLEQRPVTPPGAQPPAAPPAK